MIGITIITGFLGAGKTTLLKNLLKQSRQNGKKIAIIHNEFTENNNNIDKIVFKDINDIYNFPKEDGGADRRVRKGTNDLNNEWKNDGHSDGESDQNDITIVNRIEKEEGYIYELNNGCLCCSNKSNFVKLIENILSMKTTYDYIFVEVAGVYDNIQLNNLLWLDELNKSQIYLDSIIYLLDAYNFVNSFQGGDLFHGHGALAEAASRFASIQIQKEESLPSEEEEEKEKRREGNMNPPPKDTSPNEQLIVCDVVIINKIDKISEQEKEKIKTFVSNMNPLSQIYLTSYATLPMVQLTELKCYEKKNIKDILANSLSSHTADRKDVFHYNDFVNCSLHYEHNIPYLVHLGEQLNRMKSEFVKNTSKNTLRQILSLKKKNIFSFRKINETLVSLLWGKNLEIYRGKGVFLAFNDDVYSHKSKLKLNMYYYQSVGDLYEIDLVMSDLHTFFPSALHEMQTNLESVTVCTDKENDNLSEPFNDGDDLSDIENYLSDSSSGSDGSDASGSPDNCGNRRNRDGGEYNVKNILTGGDVFSSSFLFIGKNIDVEGIKQKLSNCMCD
ncbi:COBW domain-containing protein 1, putative [Plasmodium knowlesi strain H]|uniref:COBW domain-containing protein 1, putative n=3 Tax=Plasmodium knowlesi TaxID=5850 RepID=A0A5E7X5U9_PLAKH|nr:COBW domain-containing protein 1, putative [Plasmodium knowlesi strain H]OTN67717.1 Uncharacterized protein PKNOH_S05396500 [Plasmodium knowlesi]CAA9990552.1 COBW domain-containing protein 1, putative [Plasmodium knowlesi strain H]SBO19809.1 COBW domain-containing protein 1, putative [Plasmodium knowlesi strain H]SBO22374.1 COBW domain-containing protein 1, putative [Plasmodium knowlesi strain H]VVS80026.1 COBW domain-containing protein 1, putative [Plasmodium knowlesi strain H]